MISNGNSPPACVLHYCQTNRFLHHSFFPPPPPLPQLVTFSSLLLLSQLRYIHVHDTYQTNTSKTPPLSASTRFSASFLHHQTHSQTQQPWAKVQDSRIVDSSKKERRSLSSSLREKAHLFFAIVAFCFGNGNAHNISSVCLLSASTYMPDKKHYRFIIEAW